MVIARGAIRVGAGPCRSSRRCGCVHGWLPSNDIDKGQSVTHLVPPVRSGPCCKAEAALPFLVIGQGACCEATIISCLLLCSDMVG